jgi:hypothetical protein
MDNFELDFSLLNQEVMPKPVEKIPVRGNEGRMIRVAFDMFRLDGENKEELWQVQADDDGNEFLVRTYNLPEDEEKIAKSKWNVGLDKKGSNITIYYDGAPITRLAIKEFGVNTEKEAKDFSYFVFKKLATDKSFAQSLIKTLSADKRSIILEAEPEIAPVPPVDPTERQKRFLEAAITAVKNRFKKGKIPKRNAILQLQGLGLDEAQARKILADLELEMASQTKEEPEELSSEEKEKRDLELLNEMLDVKPEVNADEWWDALSEEDKKMVYDKFKDIPSITKEQALKLISLELKLAQQKS